jgi:hypothetical protein
LNGAKRLNPSIELRAGSGTTGTGFSLDRPRFLNNLLSLNQCLALVTRRESDEEFHFSCFLPKIAQVVLIPEFSDFGVRAGFRN